MTSQELTEGADSPSDASPSSSRASSRRFLHRRRRVWSASGPVGKEEERAGDLDQANANRLG